MTGARFEGRETRGGVAHREKISSKPRVPPPIPYSLFPIPYPPLPNTYQPPLQPFPLALVSRQTKA